MLNKTKSTDPKRKDKKLDHISVKNFWSSEAIIKRVKGMPHVPDF